MQRYATPDSSTGPSIGETPLPLSPLPRGTPRFLRQGVWDLPLKTPVVALRKGPQKLTTQTFGSGLRRRSAAVEAGRLRRVVVRLDHSYSAPIQNRRK